MAYDSEQRRTIRRIRQIAREVGASPKEVKAAFATGIVESGLRNLPGGDADSAGWRQERASLYKDPTNLDASIRRFFSETRAVKTKHGRAGDLAAAVQRPAEQYRGRYQGVSDEAQRLLGGSGGAPARVAPDAPMRSSAPTVDNSGPRGALIAQYLQRDNQDPLDFAMGIRALKDVPSAPTTQPERTGTSARPSTPPAGGGRSRSTPRNVIDLDIVPLATQLGFQVSSGTIAAANRRHGPTVSGGRSDHQGSGKDTWAADISNAGKPTKEMDALARAIAKRFGIPWKGAGAITHVANGYRYQLIYRSNVGGNHFNHVHIGVAKV